MKLISLELNNFRQFYGTQRLEFSNSNSQMVTVIHGENGSGKTALLNAFKWILYGQTDFDTKKKLINERYLDEHKDNTELNMSVVLEFEHEGIQYCATRSKKYRKTGTLEKKDIGDSVLELTYTDLEGRHTNSNNPSTHIKQMVPEDLHSYFFFNGERIDKLANDSSSEEIKSAIKKILGLEIIERAKLHLKKYVEKDLKKRLKAVATDDLNEKMDERSEIEEQIEDFKKAIRTKNKNLSEYKKDIKELEKVMDEKKDIAHLQKERKEKETQNKEFEAELQNIHKKRRKDISNNGFLAFTDKVVTEAEVILEEKREKGELPSDVKKQFIQDLIDKEVCICGRELKQNTEAFNAISKYLNKAVSQDVEDAFNKTSSAVAGIKEARKDFFERMKDLQEQITLLTSKRNRNHARIDEISNQIGKVKHEDIDKLEERRSYFKKSIDDCNYNIRRSKELIEVKEQQLKKLDLKIKEVRNLNEKQKLAQRRLNQSVECHRVLSAIHDSVSNKVRDELSIRVNNTFSAIMRKNYWAKIGTDYSLDIYKKVGENETKVFEKSTGENQVASLSFIGSLVSICRDNYNNKSNKFQKSGIFPIVMDSPYGALDKEYRSLVAKLIPELSEQIIVMLSDSQWSGEVEEELKPRVGKRYTLMYHDPLINESTVSKSVVKSEKYEFTQIKEGYHGR